MKLKDRKAEEIPTSNTVEQQRQEFRANGFTIVDGNPFVDEAVARVIEIHGNQLYQKFRIDCNLS